MLATLFFVASVLAWWVSRERAEVEGVRWWGKQGIARWGALAAMLAAMLSKETAAATPLVLIALELLCWRRSRAPGVGRACMLAHTPRSTR